MLYANLKPINVNNSSNYMQYSKPHKYLHISRYGNIPLITDKVYNEKYHETVFNYKIRESNGDKFITLDKDMRLDVLANKYYSDSTLWWVIAMANNIMDGLETVKLGTTLRIPPILNIYKSGSILGR